MAVDVKHIAYSMKSTSWSSSEEGLVKLFPSTEMWEPYASFTEYPGDTIQNVRYRIKGKTPDYYSTDVRLTLSKKDDQYTIGASYIQGDDYLLIISDNYYSGSAIIKMNDGTEFFYGSILNYGQGYCDANYNIQSTPPFAFDVNNPDGYIAMCKAIYNNYEKVGKTGAESINVFYGAGLKTSGGVSRVEKNGYAYYGIPVAGKSFFVRAD